MNHLFCKKIIKTILIFISLNNLCYSQDVIELNFQRLSKDNGLSSYGPTAVLKDSRGFIWIASQNGLNRFDGNGIKLYVRDLKNPNSISDDFITCLCEDSEGNLWVGTIGNGLNKFERKTEKFEVFVNDPNNENSISSNNIRALVFDDGKVYIGTQHGGLDIYDIKTKKFLRLKNNPNNPLSLSSNFIWTLFKDKEGTIWIGTNGKGLDKLDKRNYTFTHYNHNSDDQNSISHVEVRSIFEDSEGYLWIGTNGGGLNNFNKKTGKFKRFSYGFDGKSSLENVVVMGLNQDENGNIWIGEYTKGLSLYNPKTDKFTKVLNNTDNNVPILDGVFSIYRDNSGIIWMCHEGKGVYIYNSKKPKFELYKNEPASENSLSDNIIWSFSEDNLKNIWIAHRKGISIFNPLTKQFKHKSHNPGDDNTVSDNSVRFIFRDKTNRMWLCNNTNILDWVDLSDGFFRHYYSHPDDKSKMLANIVSMVEDKEGQLWMGTYSDGLKVFNKERTDIITYTHNDTDTSSISSNGIWSLSLDSDDNLWICTYTTGLDRLDKKTGKFTNYRNNPLDTNSLSSNLVTYLYQDKKNIYWITTLGGGLDKFDITKNTFKHYTTREGLPDNGLYGLLVDDFGRFWISTNQGLSRFDPETEKFVNYNIADGLQSQEFNQNAFFKSNTGEFYFGGVGGFNVFRPSDFSENKIMPELIFTSLKIFNKEADLLVSISEANEIELSYTDNFFTIEFAALEYTNPTKIEYAYILDDIDKKWNYSKNNRVAHYTNVSPGNYTFKVKYTNTDGLWNETGKSLKIYIAPPWWQRWWFRGLSVLIVIGIIAFGVNRKFVNIKKEKKQQQDFARKLIESHENERKKISAELHDSISQDLVIIKNSANIGLNNSTSNPDLSKFFKQISDVSASALSNVRAISHNLRPVELDKLGLTETIKSIIELVSSSSEIEITSDIDIIDNLFDKINEVNYCRIIQECINNILKHSKATKSSIQIKTGEDRIITIIKDNGVGFDYNELLENSSAKSFGLTGIKERVNIMNGSIKINSKPGSGTEVIITNPFKI